MLFPRVLILLLLLALVVPVHGAELVMITRIVRRSVSH